MTETQTFVRRPCDSIDFADRHAVQVEADDVDGDCDDQSQHPLRDRTGELIADRYRIDERLGAGSGGIIYKARDLRLQRGCAVKFFPSDRQKCHWQKRAATLANVVHPNVVTVYDADVLAEGSFETPFVVMEFANGQDLGEFVSRFGLPLLDRLGLFRSACEGVEALHQRGLVHCDLKPANILVDADKMVAKIIDFDLTMLIRPQDDVGARRAGFFGSVEWAAPEQFCLDRELTFRVDIYALGVILFELVTGNRPYSLPGNDLSKCRRVVEQVPTEQVDVKLADVRLCDGLNSLIRCAMSKIPQKRGTVRAMIDHIDRLLLVHDFLH